MANGRFNSMNKIRPGAYINFESEAALDMSLGSRGIATFAVDLDWGADDKLIEVSANDLLNGYSLAKIGLTSNDANALLFNLALQNCNLVKVYRINSGGTKATKTLDNGLVVTAKYNGLFGNKIAILIKSAGTKFSVETYADGYLVDSQKVNSISELVNNDYVVFSGEGSLSATTSTLLVGGTNGTATLAEKYRQYMDLLKTTKWNTIAVTTDDEAIITSVMSFVEEMRDEEGKYVQAVVPNTSTADYEGIINVVNSVILNDETNVTIPQFTAWVAGATAGAKLTDSLTGKIVENATGIVNPLSNNDIIDGLSTGKFILSLNQSGAVKVEKDINSLHTYTADKGYIFSKNRIIRELDEIGSAIEDIWETTYLGKVSNNDDGRTLFKSSIINYLTGLQNQGAISDFDSSTVNVEAGPDIDSVIASIQVKPVDSMEFLYMTVNVEQ